MSLKEIQNRITDCFAWFQHKIELENKAGRTDDNKYAEPICAAILNKIFDYKLEVLEIIGKNYPAIDLADFDKGIGFQVTSDSTNTKIEDMITKFTNNYNNEKYHLKKISTLKIFYLRDKNKKNTVLNVGNIKINPLVDFIDRHDLIRILSGWTDEQKIREFADLAENLIIPSNIRISNEFQKWKVEESITKYKKSIVDKWNSNWIEVETTADFKE